MDCEGSTGTALGLTTAGLTLAVPPDEGVGPMIPTARHVLADVQDNDWTTPLMPLGAAGTEATVQLVPLFVVTAVAGSVVLDPLDSISPPT